MDSGLYTPFFTSFLCAFNRFGVGLSPGFVQFLSLSLPQICDELGVKRPSSVKVFSGKSKCVWAGSGARELPAPRGGQDGAARPPAAPGLRKGHSSAGERSSSGLLEWESKSDALETLGFLNHYQMKNPSKFPPRPLPLPSQRPHGPKSPFSSPINPVFSLQMGPTPTR